MRDVQYLDPAANPPRANLLLSRLFNSEDGLYQRYRAHALRDLTGPANRASVNQWFSKTAQRLKQGDRLFIYFTGHGSGNAKQPRNTTMDLWLDGGMSVTEFNGLLDKLNPKVSVVLLMVQCHSGGFGDVIFKGAQPSSSLAEPIRCGFFATRHDRLAAGCTPDTAEENYKDYTTYFFAALSGRTRTGQPTARPDFDADGKTSLAEAHAYVVLTSDTIDIPVCTSDVLLRQFSRMNDGKVKDLMTASSKFDELLQAATPDRRAVLDGLSKQLNLTGVDRATAARTLATSIDKERKAINSAGRPDAGRQAGVGTEKSLNALRDQIKRRLLTQWPELANPLHPTVVAMLANQPDEIVKAIETDPSYKEWGELFEQNDTREEKSFDLERKWAKCQRFIYTAESVALESNLGKLATPEVIAKFEAIRAAENAPFGTPGSPSTGNSLNEKSSKRAAATDAAQKS